MASADAEVWVKVVNVPGQDAVQDVLTVGFPRGQRNIKVPIDKFRMLLAEAGYERAKAYDEVPQR